MVGEEGVRASPGSGTITRHGYRQIKMDGKYVFEHRIIWERINGLIPNGMFIHHKDENRLNNDISNLELVTYEDHRRIHSKLYERWNGGWVKRCRRCGVVLPLSAFYGEKEKRLTAECKPCYCIVTAEKAKAANRNERRKEARRAIRSGSNKSA
jgi:hypothetical protein